MATNDNNDNEKKPIKTIKKDHLSMNLSPVKATLLMIGITIVFAIALWMMIAALYHIP